MYDVIIIGAGPAGSAAARALALQKRRVLLVERNRMPRNKSCSGQLIRKTLDLVERYFDQPVPESVTCAPMENRGMIFTNDRGESFRFEQSGLNVWRASFDHWLAQRAAASGAEVVDGCYAAACEDAGDAVSLRLCGARSGTETARYVVNCEGVTGSLKQKLTHCPPEFIHTFQTFNRGSIDLDPHFFHAYLQPELTDYDAWFNIKDRQLVLGVSARDPRQIAASYQRFIRHMLRRHNLRIDEELRSERWLMPRVTPGCPIDHGVGRVLFAGEAAGFLNPMGEGVSAALESGTCAARAISENFRDPAAARADYQRRTEELRAYMLRQWNFVARMSETFSEMKQP